MSIRKAIILLLFVDVAHILSPFVKKISAVFITSNNYMLLAFILKRQTAERIYLIAFQSK